MITVVSQRKGQLMIIIYTWWASMPRLGTIFFESFEINVSCYLMSRAHLLCKIVSGVA